MITSPFPAVMPSQELARLTLISSTNEAAIRRKSLISGTRSGSLGDIGGRPVIGPLGPPQSVTTAEDSTAVGEPTTPTTPKEKLIPKEASASDADSESTLVSDAIKTDTQGSVAGNKENLAPADGEMEVVADTPNVPKQQESPPDSGSESEPFIGPIGPPNRPPPVPPRPTPQADLQKQIIEEVELGAQQDVTEVINNVLFQTQCAIKPNDTDIDGEQLDLVKE
jgi:ubiquitin carboxyl-terminal hydrolase 25/28